MANARNHIRGEGYMKAPEVKVQEELTSIINAVVKNLRTVNDYQVPEYQEPIVSFKPIINRTLHQALREYLEARIYAFHEEF